MIQNCFAEVKIYFSPRTIRMIQKFCLFGNSVFNYDGNNYVVLDFAVSQKILPSINGYGIKYKNFLENLITICDLHSMPKSYHIIKKIIEDGSNNMDYYQFFGRI